MKLQFKNDYISSFSNNKYEFIFSIFMFISAFFLKNNPEVKYPDILYPLFFLMFLNFFVNRYLSDKEKVSVWFLDIIAFSNSLVSSLIINYSGGENSIFWVMFLFPIFTIAMSAKTLHFHMVFIFIELCLLSFYYDEFSKDSLSIFIFLIKSAIIYGSGIIVYREVLAKKKLENEVLFKRLQVSKLLTELKDLKVVENKSPENNDITILSSAIHDLKNLITVIYLTSQIMEKEEILKREELSRISSAARMASNLANYALSLAVNKEIKAEKIDILSVLRDVLELMQYKIRSRRIVVDLNTNLKEAFVKISRIHIERVFINILVNSISFLPEGGIIKISVLKENDNFKIIFKDNGPGFPKEILEKIEPFKTTRGKAGGTGLGLSGSYEIIKNNGGIFSIYNSPEGGAVVEITLPIFKENNTN